MRKFFYHSKDLDGIFSGVVAGLAFQDPELIGYDYGEKFDIRQCKNQIVGMADVSLPMEDMFTLAKNAERLFWYDHHKSAFDAFVEYAKTNKIALEKTELTGLITMYEVKDLGFTYYYSSVLSGAEIVQMVEYNDYINDGIKKIIRLIGQYDTWRQGEKALIADFDWDNGTLPFQYGMRTYTKPEDVDIYQISIDEKIALGKAILEYQEKINQSIMANKFEINHNGLNILCANSNFFNSNTFNGHYVSEIHDAMLAFVYNGNGTWKFSLYTTKDVDILSIAKCFGGGGHPQACGFILPNKDIKKIFPNGFQV
jgi:oligoribonuclease NrnB/cAMP/cGMP phosphodiesterase (DHH superfamily)